jgi:cyclopropane-fatty-acyl-phospholipid synthase
MSLELAAPGPFPRRSFAGQLLERLFGRGGDALVAGKIEVTLPDGTELRRCSGRPGPAARLRILHWRALRRIALSGAVGFAEAFIDGDLETPDVRAVVGFVLANETAFGALLGGGAWTRLAGRLRHALRANTRRGSRRNIAAHYDLGNAFYRLWLDETMSYSAARFVRGDEDLAEAQRQKYRQVAALAGIAPGMRVLEIGCGWGGFATLAAGELGCHVTGLTLSAEQHRLATESLAALGLSARAEIRLQDYRDCSARYDAVVSIEMFEAVGERNWPTYFRCLSDRLHPGGRAALQIITIAPDRFERYRRSADFIQRYIFPGGMLPTEAAVVREAERAGFALDRVERFGADYARTLALWGQAFRENWPRIRRLGFDERFRRMWEYYLDYCAAGFDHRSIDVAHFALVKR